jgi:hypothetical protein
VALVAFSGTGAVVLCEQETATEEEQKHTHIRFHPMLPRKTLRNTRESVDIDHDAALYTSDQVAKRRSKRAIDV